MKRRIIIIDRQFQLRTAFAIIGIVLAALISLIAVTGIIIWDNNAKIYRAVESLSAHGNGAEPARMDSASGDDPVAIMHTLVRRNRIIITMMAVFTILLCGTLFYYLINLTNRISGPIYVLSRHVNDIMEGKKPNLRSLRKNDQFKEFYDQFIKLIRKNYGG